MKNEVLLIRMLDVTPYSSEIQPLYRIFGYFFSEQATFKPTM